MATLVVTSGPLEGERFEVGEEFTIGREQTDLHLEDEEVSRRHARFTAVPGGLELEDLGSRNGTRLNGVRIEQTVPLSDGAQVRIGQTTMRVELGAAETRISEHGPSETVVAAMPPEQSAADEPPRDRQPVEATTGRGTTEVRRSPAPHRERRPQAPAPAAPAQAADFGTFRSAPAKRRRGVATRLWLPGALTYAAVAGTAAGLIIYFA